MPTKTEEKIIMYDSPEAGRLVTVTVWEVDNPNGMIYTPKEESARWNNCTHKVCECGKPMEKSYTKCKSCRIKAATERYNALPFKEWDGKEPVCLWDGDEYFFSEEDLINYMTDDEPMKEVDLLICDPIKYTPVDYDKIAPDTHEEWEPESELSKALNALNEIISKLPPHSYSRGKVRTKYILNQQNAL